MSADLKQQNAELRAALQKIANTNASKHGTTGMMIERCMKIAREAIKADICAAADPQPVATFEGYVDDMPRITWTADPLPAGSKLYGGPVAASDDLAFAMAVPSKAHVRQRMQERCQHDFKHSPGFGGDICAKCGKIDSHTTASAGDPKGGAA